MRRTWSCRQSFESLRVSIGGALNNLRGKGWWRRLLVPPTALQKVAQELFVEAGLALARRISVSGPISGRIWGEKIVDPRELTTNRTEFKLGIRQDESARGGVRRARGVEPQTELLETGGDVTAHQVV